MSDQRDSDFSRRRFLSTAGHGLLATGLLSGVAAGAAGFDLAPPDKQPPNLPLPKPPGKKVGWAIVGLGELALEQVMPAFTHCEHSAPVALVSGHPDKAKKVAEHYGMDPKGIYTYENYDSIKDNPAVDVIYVILPNSMHAEYTARGFKAGKHVLCEKPMAPTEDECRRMIDAGKQAGKKLMIAYRLHYEPFNRAMIEIARNQEFGPIRVIEAENVQDVKAPNIRLSKQTAGGPLGDVGVYCLNACRYITGEEPVEVNAMLHRPADDARFAEVEDRILFQLRFPSGVLANCSAGFSAYPSRRYRVFCTKGWFELDPAFDYKGLRLHVEHDKIREERVLQEANHFAKEMDHFSQCVLENKEPLTPGEEGLRDVHLMTKIYEAAAGGKTVKA